MFLLGYQYNWSFIDCLNIIQIMYATIHEEMGTITVCSQRTVFSSELKKTMHG